jgi:hypothetical protein
MCPNSAARSPAEEVCTSTEGQDTAFAAHGSFVDPQAEWDQAMLLLDDAEFSQALWPCELE